MKSNTDGRDTLNLETYETMFPRTNNQLKNPNIRIEASRKSGDVIMNVLTLVEMLMDPNKWMELFPTIVTIAKTIEVISSRTKDGLSGSLQLVRLIFFFFRGHRLPSGCFIQNMPNGTSKVIKF
ncbi:hypothetical protein MtrunA17_Chr7g0224431 [Medicago truncatula]|uniref:Uncharacterized protein n=1 Tax=Medicago truncatula TaxID=3880 RepID=A0A396GWM3_MEDTR|nr:hypothetical protein MtrunA17_Chr7g0224431 [Medicago truncatula]